MAHQATQAEIDAVVDRVHEIGLKTEISKGEERTLVGVIGGNAYAYKEAFSHLGGIHEIIPITKPFKLASLKGLVIGMISWMPPRCENASL